MEVYYIDKPDPLTKRIIEKSFPDYKGRKIKLSTSIPSRVDSFWDGGSKDSFTFFHLDTGDIYNVHSNHPMFEAVQPRNLRKLPDRVLLIKHSYFCGKDMGITIYANQSDLAKLLPENNVTDLTDDEKTVLIYTRIFKNSYGGVSNVRYKEANRKFGITLENWNKAKQNLIEKRLLNKIGAITPQGRNAIANEKRAY